MSDLRYTEEVILFALACRKTMTGEQTAKAVSKRFGFACARQAIYYHIGRYRNGQRPVGQMTGSKPHCQSRAQTLRASGWMTVSQMRDRLGIDGNVADRFVAAMPPPCRVVNGLRLYSPAVCRELMITDPTVRFNTWARDFVVGAYAPPLRGTRKNVKRLAL